MIEMSMFKVDNFLSVFCIFDILILSHNKEGVAMNKLYNTQSEIANKIREYLKKM